MLTPNNTELCYYKNIVAIFENNYKPKGWRKFYSKVRDMNAFYNINKSVVVKRPSWILEPKMPPELCVPTFELGGGWVVQPLVKKICLKKAVDILRKELNNYPDLFPDLHTQNVGWYKNKPVMYDW
jgi:hypothetical protein